MLTDIRLWKRYPLLCVVRFMNNTIRTTALLFFIMIISIVTTSNKVSNLPVGFIAVSLGLNWLLMIYFGAKLRRFKVWLYPVMFIINPFFNWVYMVYGIFTAGQRTWGGPRADAGAADAHVTPQQAIEHAIATGDDLNVVPETFKPAVEAKHPEHIMGTVPLQPTGHLEGRFAPAERLPGGWYLQNNDSGFTLPNMLPRDPNLPSVPLHPRDSFDSFVTTASPTNSVYFPRPVEEFMSEDDRLKYRIAQQAQQQPRGAYMSMQAQHGQVYEMADEISQKRPWSELNESSDLGNESGSYDPYIVPRSRAANAHPGVPAASTLSDANAPNIELEDRHRGSLNVLGLPHSAGERSSLGPNRRIRGERSPLGREPLTRQPTLRVDGFDEEEAKLSAQPQDSLINPQDRQQNPSATRPLRHRSPPPASYRPPHQQDTSTSRASSTRTSRAGSLSETDSQGKKKRSKLQKIKPKK